MNLDTLNHSALLRGKSASADYLGLTEKFSDFIIISPQPFTQRNLDRFGATWLLDHGKKVHLIDLSSLVWGQALVEAGQADAVRGVLRPTNWDDVESLLSRHRENGLLLPYVTGESTVPLLQMMTKHSPATLFYECGSRAPESRSWSKLIAAKLQRFISSPRSLLRSARNRVTMPAVTVDYHVMTGTDCEIRPHHCAQKAKLTVPSHSFDYALWNAASPYIQSKPYIVFLDQAYPDHPDFIKLFGTNPFTRENYYPEIERFLRLVSNRFGMPVLIALHPRSSQAAPRPYQEFQALRGRTASLVKGAALVVAHDSSAVSLAVLDRKPLLLVELDERSRRLHIGNVTRNMAGILAAPVAHISSRTLPPLEKINVDESRYASYEALYVRHPGCNGIPVWDRVFGTAPVGPSAAACAPERAKLDENLTIQANVAP